MANMGRQPVTAFDKEIFAMHAENLRRDALAKQAMENNATQAPQQVQQSAFSQIAAEQARQAERAKFGGNPIGGLIDYFRR